MIELGRKSKEVPRETKQKAPRLKTNEEAPRKTNTEVWREKTWK